MKKESDFEMPVGKITVVKDFLPAPHLLKKAKTRIIAGQDRKVVLQDAVLPFILDAAHSSHPVPTP